MLNSNLLNLQHRRITIVDVRLIPQSYDLDVVTFKQSLNVK